MWELDRDLEQSSGVWIIVNMFMLMVMRCIVRVSVGTIGQGGRRCIFVLVFLIV